MKKAITLERFQIKAFRTCLLSLYYNTISIMENMYFPDMDSYPATYYHTIFRVHRVGNYGVETWKLGKVILSLYLNIFGNLFLACECKNTACREYGLFFMYIFGADVCADDI